MQGPSLLGLWVFLALTNSQNVHIIRSIVWRKTKGQHDEGQQNRESPGGTSSSERVSERTSENFPLLPMVVADPNYPGSTHRPLCSVHKLSDGKSLAICDCNFSA